MQFVAYEITFPTMSNLYIIILILFARFLAKRITSIFIQDFCLKKNDKIFNLILLKKSYSSKNYSENIIVFIISFYFHLYQNRNLFCWKICFESVQLPRSLRPARVGRGPPAMHTQAHGVERVTCSVQLATVVI